MAPTPVPSPSFAVTWREREDGPLYAGELVLARERLHLKGTARAGVLATLGIPYTEITGVSVGRSPAERIRGRIAIVLTLHDGPTLHIGAIAGQGTVVELAELITRRLPEQLPLDD